MNHTQEHCRLMNLKSNIFLFLFLMACLSSSFTGRAQGQPAARAFISDHKIVIGDQLRLWLEIKPASRKDMITWPKLPDSLTGLEIVERGRIDTIQTKDTFLLRQRLLVTGFDSGSYYFPSLAFRVVSNGQPLELYTDSLLVQVQTVAVDTTKAFKPIKDIVSVPFSIWEYWKEMLGGLLLILLGIFIGIYLYKRSKNKKPAAEKVPPEKAHEKALRLLDELKGKQWPEQGRSKEYFSELSDIVRVYLEERFGIAAMEQTTDELLALLKKQNESRSELRKLRPELKLILRTADLVKFAKANPLPHEHSESMAAALLFIQRTQMKAGEGEV